MRTKPVFLRQRRWYHRVRVLTWLLLALLVADIAAPGYLRFNFLAFTVDATNAVDTIQHSNPHP